MAKQYLGANQQQQSAAEKDTVAQVLQPPC